MTDISITRDPQEYVRYLLRRLALEVTQKGDLASLAEDLGLHYVTIARWAAQGWVPRNRAEFMQRKYGEALAPANALVGDHDGASEDESN